MTSLALPIRDEVLRAALAYVVGARIDAALIVAETGLVTLSLYQGRKLLLGVGIGPIVSGVGVLPRLPQGRTATQHPLVAAMHAHLVGKHIRSVNLDDSTVWFTTEPVDDARFPTRLALEVGPHGSAQLMLPFGATISWPPEPRPKARPRTDHAPAPSESSLESCGVTLVQSSDSYLVESFRRKLWGALRQKQKRLEKRALAVQSDLARLDDVPRLQKIGALLLAQGPTIPRGTTTASLVDWETGENVVVDIAPDKPAKEQAAGFFQKARRLQRGADVMQKRLDETLFAISKIQPFDSALQNAPADWDALQTIAKQMLAIGLLGQTPADATKSRNNHLEPGERKPYHTFRSPKGQSILVGRSAKDNDELVTRIARPHDLWLHAKNMRGAHVVVPREKNHACPADLLVDAATLAAYFSDARNETTCEVTYVERRYVRKPKKSAPGEVTTQREKVILVRIEKDRLSRLLRSKDEM